MLSKCQSFRAEHSGKVCEAVFSVLSTLDPTEDFSTWLLLPAIFYSLDELELGELFNYLVFRLQAT